MKTRNIVTIVLSLILIISISGCVEEQETTITEGLLKDIEDSRSVMWIGPHADDEHYMSGTLGYLCRNKGYDCTIVAFKTDDKKTEANKESAEFLNADYIRIQDRMNKTRLDLRPNCSLNDCPGDTVIECMVDCIVPDWTEKGFKEELKKIIQEKKPGLIFTFEPSGSMYELKSPPSKHPVSWKVAESEHGASSIIVKQAIEELDIDVINYDCLTTLRYVVTNDDWTSLDYTDVVELNEELWSYRIKISEIYSPFYESAKRMAEDEDYQNSLLHKELFRKVELYKQKTDVPITNGLLKDIEEGKSIMGFWPHPDDECYTPGIFPLACGDRGNKCWVISLVSLSSIPEDAQVPRAEAIQWFRETYLWPNGGDYINLDMIRYNCGKYSQQECEASEGCHWENGRCMSDDLYSWDWSVEEVKEVYKAHIEEKQPDILLTFTPDGYMGNSDGRHAAISNIVTDIWDELTYEPKPKIYWFINMDQGPRSDGPFYEYQKYPPTDVLDLDVYSEVLGMTYWEAKVDIWEHYALSMGSLQRFLDSQLFLDNDRKEYFRKVK